VWRIWLVRISCPKIGRNKLRCDWSEWLWMVYKPRRIQKFRICHPSDDRSNQKKGFGVQRAVSQSSLESRIVSTTESGVHTRLRTRIQNRLQTRFRTRLNPTWLFSNLDWTMDLDSRFRVSYSRLEWTPYSGLNWISDSELYWIPDSVLEWTPDSIPEWTVRTECNVVLTRQSGITHVDMSGFGQPLTKTELQEEKG
jgi:hypothetical protein